MSALMNALARSIRFTSALSRTLAGSIANRAFFSTDPRMRVREADRVTHETARRGTLLVRGHRITTYQWGAGSRTALLMHGWSGRASQFATLVRDLTAEGFRVVSFDAPAHGSSAAAATDVRDWVDAAQQLSAAEGPFDLIVGHSFGAFAALAAVRAGVTTPRLVTIAGAGTVDAFHSEFERMLRLTPRTRAAFEASFYRRLGMTRTDATALYDSLAHPLRGTTLLIAHDRDDPALSAQNSERLHAAHPGSHLLLTDGFGHNRILASDEVLDAVLAFAVRPAPVAASPQR